MTDLRYARLEPRETRRTDTYGPTSSLSEDTLFRAYGLDLSANIASPTVPPRGGRLDEEFRIEEPSTSGILPRPTGLVAVGVSPELER